MIHTIFCLYILKSAMVLTILYVPYLLLLRKERQFRLNRGVLLGILVLSPVLPLCNISALSLDRHPAMRATQKYLIEIGIPTMVEADGELMAVAPCTAKQKEEGKGRFHYFCYLYGIGMVAVIARRRWEIYHMNQTIRHGALWHEKRDGMHIYCHAREVAPFSWMKYVVIGEKDYSENGKEILLHEQGHILHHHSYDILFLTFVQALQWWNPFVYLLGTSLRDVHEYEADDHVLRQGISAHNYQLLLINKAVDSSSYTFVNSFKHSLTKKRITMMQKNNSSKWMRYKALYVIPMTALALSAFGTPSFSSSLEETVSRTTGKGTTNSAFLQEKPEGSVTGPTNSASQNNITVSRDTVTQTPMNEPMPVIQNIVEDTVPVTDPILFPDVVASFPGGDGALLKHMQDNIKYPIPAQKLEIQGRLLVRFIIEEDGRASTPEIKMFAGKTLPQGDYLTQRLAELTKQLTQEDKEVDTEKLTEQVKAEMMLFDEAIRLINSMPKWTPGKKDGQAIRSYFTIPVMFKLN